MLKRWWWTHRPINGLRGDVSHDSLPLVLCCEDGRVCCPSRQSRSDRKSVTWSMWSLSSFATFNNLHLAAEERPRQFDSEFTA
jgi:hypothetical protein